MALLMWGKPQTFEKGTAGDNPTYTTMPMPKQDSLQLTTEEGEVVEAFEEGGDIIDSYSLANKYTLEWDEFVIKNGTPAFTDENGVVAGEHTIRILGMDNTVPGIMIPRCTISVTENYTVKEGHIRHYKAKILKPTTGKMIQPYNHTAGDKRQS